MWIQRIALPARAFSSSACLYGKRSREPFDKRFPSTGKHASRFKKGGSPIMEKFLAVHNVQAPGFYDKQRGHWRNVPEMIPEFIVPDLTDFPLKPYVSYRASEINQSKMTARDLFQATYGAEITSGFKEGKVSVKDGKLTKKGEER